MVVGAKSDEQSEQYIVSQCKMHLKMKSVARIGHNIRFKKTPGKFISTFFLFRCSFRVFSAYRLQISMWDPYVGDFKVIGNPY